MKDPFCSLSANPSADTENEKKNAYNFELSAQFLIYFWMFIFLIFTFLKLYFSSCLVFWCDGGFANSQIICYGRKLKLLIPILQLFFRKIIIIFCCLTDIQYFHVTSHYLHHDSKTLWSYSFIVITHLQNYLIST